MTNHITKPHDSFVKAIMGDRKIADQLLRAYLPAHLVAQLGPEPPEPIPVSFVDDSLTQTHTDVLFRVRLRDGSEVWPYILVEHKSQRDRSGLIQLLRYTTLIVVDSQGKAGSEQRPVPAIVPVLVHHGPEGWHLTTKLLDLVQDAPDEFRSYLLFRHELVDLAGIEDEAFPQEARLRTFLMLLKYIQRKDLALHLPRILVNLRLLTATDRTLILSYINQGPMRISKAELEAALEHAAPGEAGRTMGHFTQEYVEEGLQKGRQALARAVVQMLEQRLAPVPAPVRERVFAADLATLEAWHGRAVVATSLESVFAPLPASDSASPAATMAPTREQPERNGRDPTAQEMETSRRALAEVAVQYLEQRMGPLAEGMRERVLAADLTTLQMWLRWVAGATPPAQGSESPGASTAAAQEGPEGAKQPTDVESARQALLQEGGRETLAGAVIEILEQRFRPVPDDVRARVRAADLATLQTWHRRAVGAASLASVFEPSSNSTPRPGA